MIKKIEDLTFHFYYILTHRMIRKIPLYFQMNVLYQQLKLFGIIKYNFLKLLFFFRQLFIKNKYSSSKILMLMVIQMSRGEEFYVLMVRIGQIMEMANQKINNLDLSYIYFIMYFLIEHSLNYFFFSKLNELARNVKYIFNFYQICR